MRQATPTRPDIDEPCEPAVYYPTGYVDTPPDMIERIADIVTALSFAIFATHDDGPLLRELRQQLGAPGSAQLLAQAAAMLSSFTPPATSPTSRARRLAYAITDLAVSGRRAFDAFRANPPQDADVLALARAIAPATVNQTVLAAQVGRVLTRAYITAWTLRGWWRPRGQRWIAVSGDDDPPHRPVNVPGPRLGSTILTQYDLRVAVEPTRTSAGRTVDTRFVMVGRDVPQPAAAVSQLLNGGFRVPPPDVQPPQLPDDSRVILFIHGHSSRLEECLDVAGPLVELGYTIIAMDLPNCGYASMFEHTEIAPAPVQGLHNATRGPYAALDFLEQFIVDFVRTLDAQQQSTLTPKIVGLMGGSLGANLGLRLAQRDPYRYPWLNNIVAWSPASMWGQSWARARLFPSFESGTFVDIGKSMGVLASRSRMYGREDESGNARRGYFSQVFIFDFGAGVQSQRWYRDGWPCKPAIINSAWADRREIYSAAFRRWHWRVAHEQLCFMHNEPPVEGGIPRYRSIRSRVLFAASELDNSFPERLWDNVRTIATEMINTPGHSLWLKETGHSIPNERPRLFAREMAEFLPPRRPHGTVAVGPRVVETWDSPWTIVGVPAQTRPPLRPLSLAVGTNSDGTLEVLGLHRDTGDIWRIKQNLANGAWHSEWARLGEANGIPAGVTFGGRLAVATLSHTHLQHDAVLRLYVRRTDQNNWVVHLTQREPNGEWQVSDLGNHLRQLLANVFDGPVVEERVGDDWNFPAVHNPRRLHLVGALLNDGRVVIRGQTTVGFPGAYWNNLPDLGLGTFTGVPVIGRNQNRRLELFARTADGAVFHNQERGSDLWGAAWAEMDGAEIAGDLAVALSVEGHLHLFGAGRDGTLRHIRQTDTVGTWGQWRSIGGTTVAPGARPAVVRNAWGRLQIFVRSSDNSIQTMSQSLTDRRDWGSWTNLGGNVRSDPYVGINANGTCVVFALAGDSTLIYTSQRTRVAPR